MSYEHSDNNIDNTVDLGDLPADHFGTGNIAAAIRAGKAASTVSLVTVEGITHAVVPRG